MHRGLKGIGVMMAAMAVMSGPPERLPKAKPKASKAKRTKVKAARKQNSKRKQ